MKGYRFQVLGYSSLFFILSTVTCTLYPTLATENDIGYSKIHPASPFYFLKTIREELELKLALTPHVRRVRQLEFATRRLREARTLIPINPDLIPPTLERYTSHLNTLVDKGLEDEEIVERIKESLAIHPEVLQQMSAASSNLRAKMAIRSAMNRIIRRADVPDDAKTAVCIFFTKEASTSATLSAGFSVLNQTEKAVLLERAKRCSL